MEFGADLANVAESDGLDGQYTTLVIMTLESVRTHVVGRSSEDQVFAAGRESDRVDLGTMCFVGVGGFGRFAPRVPAVMISNQLS